MLKRLGDGLMALFGYPQAQENDAERAVRAALAIQRALADLNASNAAKGAPELSARIGIESGSVVVDAAGEVFGEAPNVAARVKAAAEPGTVLVTATVQRQTAGLFVVEDKGAHDLKGVPAPLDALSHRAGERRRPARRRAHPDARSSGERTNLRCSRAAGRARSGRGPVRSDRRRAWHRQVAAHRGVSREARARRRTPGSNGPPRNSCRTRRSTRSPNGDGSASAAPRRPPSGGSRTSSARSRR